VFKVEGGEVVEEVEEGEVLEEFKFRKFRIKSSIASFFICIGCSLVPRPLSLVPGCFYVSLMTLNKRKYVNMKNAV